MKWLAIFLLVLNVAYFGWQMNRRIDHMTTSTPGDIVAMASDVRLVLLSELQELSQPLTNGKAAPGTQDQSISDENLVEFKRGGDCLTLGPFISRQERTNTRSWLQARQITVLERQEEQKRDERYWVYLPSKPSEAEARLQMQEFRNKGIEDFYLINEGNMKNAISLGLFNTQESVSRRLRELNIKGYNPVVVPQHKTTQFYWLDVRIDQSARDVQQSGILPNLPEGINVTDRDCSEIALLYSDQ